MPFRGATASFPVFLAALSMLGVTACSGGGAAVAHHVVSRPVQLTGTQLAGALLTASAFPRGFRYDRLAAFNSGNRLETGPAKHHPDSMSCADFPNSYTRPGFGETALALNDYSTRPGDHSTRRRATLAQMVYQFASGRQAKALWRGLRSVAARCPAWGDTPPAETTTRIFAVPLPGALAFQMDATITGQFGTTRLKSLVAVADQDVFDIDVSSIRRSLPARPSVGTLMRELIARVLAAR